MIYRVCKSFAIENGHLLSKHPGKCRFPHGHSRRIDVVVAAGGLDAHDMVCDFAALKAALQDFLAGWDHALCLNTDDPAFAEFRARYGDRVVPFDRRDPTSEVMAHAVFEELQRRLAADPPGIQPGVRVVRVRVTETGGSWAEYSEP